MEDSENHRRKLKEDLVLKDDELREMQQHLFDLNKQQQEENRIHEAQVRQFSFGREFMATNKSVASGCLFYFLNFSANQSFMQFSLGGAIPGEAYIGRKRMEAATEERCKKKHLEVRRQKKN